MTPYACIGAVTRRVVEEAAKLGAYQIVASRRQCDQDGGYLEWNQAELVEVVGRLSNGMTEVVRDHGGPKGMDDASFLVSLQRDYEAGFDVLHIDVCKYTREDQPTLLRLILNALPAGVPVEIGGERETNEWNNYLLDIAASRGANVAAVVAACGGHIWNDQQIGSVPDDLADQIAEFRLPSGTALKAHNCDWLWGRGDLPVHELNIAPEFSLIETYAWKDVMSGTDWVDLMRLGYQGNGWRNWFANGEGSLEQRAVCGIRYILETDEARGIISRYEHREDYVRAQIREAIEHAI